MEDIYNNTRPFCLMEPALKEALIKHFDDKGKILYLDVDGVWTERNNSYSLQKTRVYRAVRVPVIEKAVLFGIPEKPQRWWATHFDHDDTHKITYNIVDGEVDCFSIKMEKL